MAEDTTKALTISKNNTGFPEYLNFTKLRTEGINYLGKLAGKIWNDHNLHDPGITIFEELCYAALDLGYRSNLTVADILAKSPAIPSPEENFFTPAQILSNNPLTIIDYRKLLIDIPGIRNAWLEPAMDIKDICRRENPDGSDGSGCNEFLNGIYHVIIETEVDIDKDFANEDPKQEDFDKQAFVKQITDHVRKVLMSHRNLCEDFEGIYILCKLEVGICATIDIEDGANVEEVYVQVANRIREFLSPSPHFYTLEQLLVKGYSMDEAFSGRPFSKESHGFIETTELDSIRLNKEIHTSDIYNEIFKVDGVKKVSRLKFKSCGKPCFSIDGKPNTDWIFHLPQNHMPVFSLACSGFDFRIHGLPINFDQDKFNSQLELGWLHNGKILYKMPSPYLDAAMPHGNYHADLGEHYSIINDFPAVYGIGEGDLPDDVSDSRKAQMLQLRGYLLFFDQMLANYLSQLQNIRQLFSYKHPVSLQAQHTYFLNNITSIPEMDKLLRFGAGNGLGPAGTLLAFPVDKSSWDTTIFATQNAASILAGFTPFNFTSFYSVYESTDLLRNDLIHEGESAIVTKQTLDLKWLYSIVSSTDDFVLVGNKDFETEEDAQKHASSVQYAGVFENNYRNFMTGSSQFTFDLELNLITYTDYLGLLVEDEELYNKRRAGFLTHLLSRFAEQFTDFVIYNWKSSMGVTDIYAAESYLTNYPNLSRNRGKAFNYLLDGMINYNVSGFEKKVKAIAGINSTKKNYLCNFVVEPFDETYFLDPLLKTSNVNRAITTGRAAASEKLGYIYRLVDKEHLPALFSMNFNDKDSALGNRKQLADSTSDLLTLVPNVLLDQDIVVALNPLQFSFIITLNNLGDIAGNVVLFQGIKVFNSKEEASAAFHEHLIDVLNLAATPGSYGEQIVSGTQPGTDKTLVRIPDDALTTLENTWGATWVDKLATVLTRYPIRKIDIHSLPYALIFCKDYVVKEPEIKYYFSLPLEGNLSGNWFSTEHFDTKEEAIEEFSFFKMLAKYAGNYFADCTCTSNYDNGQIYHSYSFKLFLREVLAQSTDVFATVEDAWGTRGIEKFICATQGEHAFWTYKRDKECNSFYVTCGSGTLQHPCQYDSERDFRKVSQVLQEQTKAFIEQRSWTWDLNKGLLMDNLGKPFAQLDPANGPNRDLCNLFVHVAELIGSVQVNITYDAGSGFLEYRFPDKPYVISSTEAKRELSDEEIKAWMAEWERLLHSWACYFPIVRTKLPTTKGQPEFYKYCVEIRLPEFNDCNFREQGNLCYMAWTSSCCYATCAEALAELEEFWKTQLNTKDFRSVFSCEEKTFGIALHTFQPALVANDKPAAQSDIIAINPQCYPTTDIDCKAVERAKKLINVQGMHLMEHILLRPIKPEDCRCRTKLAACSNNCDHLPNWVIEDPACEGKTVQVCFKPGTDPYSFIATIILPAWSKRFRDEKERKLFERLLYREAPAHVLLRIIWLRPRDFCRLESIFFQWQKWIAGMTNCNIDFSLCNFIDLLFGTYYDCLPQCVDCLPCPDLVPPKPACWDDKPDSGVRPLDFVDQINELFCFTDYCRTRDQRPDKLKITDEKLGKKKRDKG